MVVVSWAKLDPKLLPGPGSEKPAAIYETDISVNAKDLRPGDRIVARVVDDPYYDHLLSGTTMKGRKNFYGQEMVVFDVNSEYVSTVCWPLREAKLTVHTFHTMQEFWIRARVPGVVKNNKFPHTCEYCKQPCWFGFNRVEHEREGTCRAH